MLIDIEGSTQVRFGPFLAMASAATTEETNTAPVWKVWVDPGDKTVGKVAIGLTRVQAVALAKMCADEWRRIDKPEIHEVGVVADGPVGPFKIVINRKHRACFELPKFERMGEV